MRRTLVIVLALAVVLGVGVLAGCGSPDPFDVSGTTVGTSSTMGDPTIEGNTMTITSTDTSDLTGDLVGANESKTTMVIDTSSGSLTIEYDVTFDGSIGDKSGTITSHGAGSGQMVSGDSGTWAADETVTGGTGDFEGITGTMHADGQFTSAGGQATYSGTLQYK
jgi:hypothetical protein